MNILYITLEPMEYASSAMLRNLSLIEGLLSLGYRVDLLTSPPYPNYTALKTDILEHELLTITRTPRFDLYAKTVAQRKKSQLSFVTSCFNFLRSIYHKFAIFEHSYMVARKANVTWLQSDCYDLVITSSDPKSSHKTVQYLKKSGLKFKKWVQYWGDPMTLDITRKCIFPPSLIKLVEYRTIKDADAIIYVSPFTHASQCDFFPKMRKKMHFLPIPYSRHLKTESTAFKKGSFWRIGYFGDYSSTVRNILPLYHACAGLPNDTLLHIVGNTDIKLDKKTNITIESRQAPRIIQEYELNSDILVCLMNRTGTQIPGKLYHCAGTDKPVLVIIDGEKQDKMIKYLETFKRFAICYNKTQDITWSLQQIMNTFRRYVPSPEFAPERIAQEFVNTVLG